MKALILPLALIAAEPRDPLTMTDADWVDPRFNQMDHGRALHYSFDLPGRRVPKGVALRLGEKAEVTYCFDTLLVAPAGAWTGGFVELSSRRFGLIGDAKATGDNWFASRATPGVAKGRSFADSRASKTAPLPLAQGRYEGLYRHGDKAVLEYTAEGTRVLELPWVETRDGLTALTRTLEIAPGKSEFSLFVLGKSKSRVTNFQRGNLKSVELETGAEVLAVSAVGGGAVVAGLGGDAIQLRIPPRNKSVLVKVFVWKGERRLLPQFIDFVKDSPAAESPAALTRGGAPRWPKALATKGRVGLATGPFAIDTITMPFDNPHKALFFAGGHDFLKDGRAAVGTVHGDVWLVDGLDEKLQKITWRRFATGLYQPLGLKIVDDRVFVLGKDQITELRDLNGDGEADYYRNFNNQSEITGGGHNYATCLETDPQGNFWFIRCSDGTPHGGTVLKVAKDGSGIEVVATGFRNPNGFGVSPTGVVTAADQQGTWVPETRLDVIKPGGFHGFVPSSKRKEEPKTFDGPLCWIPRVLDNSAGGQTWVPEGKWGPLGGQMIHLSYGRCTIMAVLRDEANAGAQGALVPLPGRFEAGVHRGRFHPKDGHLYLTGLMGWQTVGLADGCFQRVRFTGRGLFLPTAFAVHENGVRLTFNEPLRKELAEDTGSYNAEMWNYLWSKEYGSKDWSVRVPGRQGRDPVEVKSAKLLAGGKTVFLELAGLRPAHQLALQYNLTAANGLKRKDVFYTTVNQLAVPHPRK